VLVGHTSVVHGYIFGMGTNVSENVASIAALPEHDTRPYLTRDMFALPHMDHSYWDQLIAFGLVYNRVELWWEAWLEKFEALLRTMYWDEAHVYLQTDLWGSYHYVWTPLPIEMSGPVQQWTFSGGPRTGLGQTYVLPDKP
jgi:hypothetical protein